MAIRRYRRCQIERLQGKLDKRRVIQRRSFVATIMAKYFKKWRRGRTRVTTRDPNVSPKLGAIRNRLTSLKGKKEAIDLGLQEKKAASKVKGRLGQALVSAQTHGHGFRHGTVLRTDDSAVLVAAGPGGHVWFWQSACHPSAANASRLSHGQS